MRNSSQTVPSVRHMVDIEPLAIVENDDHHFPLAILQNDLCLGGAGVLGDVGKALLNEPIHGELGPFIEAHRFEINPNFDPGSQAEISRQVFQ